MKNIKLNIAVLFIAIFAFTGCDSDDVQDDSILTLANANVSYDIPFGSQVDLIESETVYTYTVELSSPQIVDVYIPVVLVDGATATEDVDFSFDHELLISKRSTMATGTITIHRDLDVEQTESFTIRIGDPILNTNSTPQEITFNLEDYVTCNWTFEMTDTYGDGWNGGYLEVDSNGDISQYACQNLDGTTGAETQTVDVAIQSGVDFSITYVSGGGTGGGPGWESENIFTITAPDGTVYTDGPIPTEGMVVSGSEACN